VLLLVAVADPEFYNGGGRLRGRGIAPPQKKNEFLPETGHRWVLVHSRITFYVYAKIGQVNGAAAPPLPESATGWWLA